MRKDQGMKADPAAELDARNDKGPGTAHSRSVLPLCLTGSPHIPSNRHSAPEATSYFP